MDWVNCYLNFQKKFRTHAIERMYERNISFEDLSQIKTNVKVIEEHPDDKPYPSTAGHK